MKFKHEMEPKLAEKLSVLDKPAARSQEMAQAGRVKFMQQAQELAPGVTRREDSRLKAWMVQLGFARKNLSTKKGLSMGTLITIIVIVGLAMGGGVTAVSADNSLPEQALYALKVWGEDTRLNLTADPQNQLDLALKYADRRIQEMQTMLGESNVPPESVVLRYQNQLTTALQLAANLPEGEMMEALAKIQTRLEAHERAMLQININADPNGEALRTQVHQIIQNRLRVVADGITTPLEFHQSLQFGDSQEKGNNPDDKPEPKPEDPGKNGNSFTEDPLVPGSENPGNGEAVNPAPGTPIEEPGQSTDTPGEPNNPGNNSTAPGNGGEENNKP